MYILRPASLLAITFVSLSVLLLTFATTAFADIVSGTFSTGDNASNGATTLTINAPAGVTSGDFLLATVSFDKGASTTISMPAGWTLIRTTNNGIKAGIVTYYRFAGASEPASYTWNLNPFRRAVGGIV